MISVVATPSTVRPSSHKVFAMKTVLAGTPTRAVSSPLGRAEIPYSVHLDGDFSDTVKARATVIDSSVKIKGDKAEITLTIAFNTKCYASSQINYISAVELGEEREVNRSGLSIYVANEGDTPWDVCKALTATPEQILAQNPNITYPLKYGDKIIYFRRITK